MAMRLVPKDSDTAALILTDTGVGSVLSSMASDSAIGLNWLSVVNWKGAEAPLSGMTFTGGFVDPDPLWGVLMPSSSRWYGCGFSR